MLDSTRSTRYSSRQGPWRSIVETLLHVDGLSARASRISDNAEQLTSTQSNRRSIFGDNGSHQEWGWEVVGSKFGLSHFSTRPPATTPDASARQTKKT